MFVHHRARLTRREWACRMSKLGIGTFAGWKVAAAANLARQTTMGIAVASYGRRWKSKINVGNLHPFDNALDFLEHAQALGAGGIQVGVGGWEVDFAKRLRAQASRHQMYVEGQIGLPQHDRDRDRFEDEIRIAKAAGVEIFRVVALNGRRYETFTDADSFTDFQRRSVRSVFLAEPIAKKHGVRVAIENHKDWRVDELLEILEKLASEWVGVCLDTGNSIALLEDPLQVVKAYAPWTLTAHFKDMALQPYRDGFLLSEVPLGEGVLDLRQIMQILSRSGRRIHLNLEMITRDPLKVPCLAPVYWSTLGDLPAIDLAKTLALARIQPKAKVPAVEGLTAAECLQLEEDNVRKSLAWARENVPG